MKQRVLDNFKEYVSRNYTDKDLDSVIISSNINCSRSYLNEIVFHEYNYSLMKYVEYFRICKAIELLAERVKKVHSDVGYHSASVFSRAFLRVTGFNASCFTANELAMYKDIIEIAVKAAAWNPKKAMEFILNNKTIRDILLERQLSKEIKYLSLL
jgi:AraC-like DNA-binding protein